VTVECLDSGEDFAVVSARDQDLGARAYGGLEDGERACGELMLLDLCDFILAIEQSALAMQRYGGEHGRTLTLTAASRAALCSMLALHLQLQAHM
jgi:hypothetical protein